ncbi:MAG: hypothetical protein JXR49_22240 [Acidobacteria bacterium]|nr:hypothetical protein [Acidobacteriota bacterium]
MKLPKIELENPDKLSEYPTQKERTDRNRFLTNIIVYVILTFITICFSVRLRKMTNIEEQVNEFSKKTLMLSTKIDSLNLRIKEIEKCLSSQEPNHANKKVNK